MTDDLRQRIADALYDTYGQQDRNRSNAIADTVLAVVQPELARLQNRVDRRGIILCSMERQEERTLAAVVKVCSERDATRAALDRVRALHERREGDDGSSYCDLCSNHGDINWPCTTIRALDGTQAEPPRCVECGHPKADHQDADEPVSVGLCKACDEADDDDAHHDYEPAEEA